MASKEYKEDWTEEELRQHIADGHTIIATSPLPYRLAEMQELGAITLSHSFKRVQYSGLYKHRTTFLAMAPTGKNREILKSTQPRVKDPEPTADSV